MTDDKTKRGQPFRRLTGPTATCRLILLAIAGLLAACRGPPGSDTDPRSPAFQQAGHVYEMGCRPDDLQGYEHNSAYCKEF